MDKTSKRPSHDEETLDEEEPKHTDVEVAHATISKIIKEVIFA